MSLEVCDEVEVVCQRGSLPTLSDGQEVAEGQQLGGCSVIRARPSRCSYMPFLTSVFMRYASDVTINREERFVKIVRGREVWLFEREVWDNLMKKVEPLTRSEPPPDPGVLLHGPPGTGKSTVMGLLGELLGLRVNTIEATILSKWIGESENRLAQALDAALRRPRSLVIIDDAEWILSTRELSGSTETAADVLDRMKTIMFDRLQRMKNTGVPSLVVAATNMSVSAIDPAFLRSGRFGRPIFFPLPDFTAIKEYLKMRGLSEEEADSGARQLALAGASWPDAERYVDAKLKGEEFKFEAIGGRGYIRVVPQLPINVPNLEQRLSELLDEIKLSEHVFHSPSRAMFIGRPRFWIPILAELSARYGRGAIVINSAQHYEEAILTAEDARSALIVPVANLGPVNSQNVMLNAKTAAFFIATEEDIGRGITPSGIQRLSTEDEVLKFASYTEERMAFLLSLLFSYYGIKYTQESMKRLVKVIMSPPLGSSEGSKDAAERLRGVTKLVDIKIADSAEEAASINVLRKLWVTTELTRAAR